METMKMKMEKGDYKNALLTLPPGVLDGLRKLVEFVDKAPSQEHRRDVRFNASSFWDESGFLGSLFGELTWEKGDKGAKEVGRLLKTDWLIFSDDEKGVLQLQYENYASFKSALKEILLQQPFGYKRTLERPVIKPQVKVTPKNGVIYLQFGEERPIRIADTEDKQGKLLRVLGDPVGASHRIESVSEELHGDIATIKNAMKEIQRKLTARHKPRSLRLGFSETMVWLEVV